VQLFRYAALQVLADGSGQALPLAGEGLVPYTSFDSLTVPAPDAALAFVAPTPDQPDYPARLQVFLQAVVREPFWSAYDASGGVAVWGLPTSAPAADPYNPAFVYQRFQNGILFSNAVSGTTQPLPLGAYLRAVLTGEDLPADLASAAAHSPLLHQYAAEQANGLARPDVLPQTDLTDAFVPDVA
jgi:hypothetical protein